MKDYLVFFRESYDRIAASASEQDEFLDAFYETFIARSGEIAQKFALTDMQRQREMLLQSLQQMVEFSVQRKASEALRRTAERHSALQLDIDPGLYDTWLDSLVDAVKLFDPRFSEEIELAWRVVLAPGVAYMKFRYDKPAATFHFSHSNIPSAS